MIRCTRVFPMEFSYELIGIYICLVLPRVVFRSIAFPFDEVLELSPEYVAVQDFLYLEVFLAVNQLWWGRQVSLLARYWVVRSWC